MWYTIGRGEGRTGDPNQPLEARPMTSTTMMLEMVRGSVSECMQALAAQYGCMNARTRDLADQLEWYHGCMRNLEWMQACEQTIPLEWLGEGVDGCMDDDEDAYIRASIKAFGARMS